MFAHLARSELPLSRGRRTDIHTHSAPTATFIYYSAEVINKHSTPSYCRIRSQVDRTAAQAKAVTLDRQHNYFGLQL